MSRSGYSDDCDNLALYRHSVDVATNGKRGQAFLRDLVTALDALPQKRLIAEDLVAPDGSVCALGALGVKRGIDMKQFDPYEPQPIGEAFNIAKCLAAETVYMNDEYFEGCTPEQRWEHMRKWAAENLLPKAQP